MVDRSSPEARKKSVMQLKSVLRKGISVFIFPEDTFNMTTDPLKDFYDGAFRTAVETQTPIKPILFIDNDERMNHKSIFSLMPGICRCVYLDEIKVDGYSTKEDIQLLKQKVYDIMETGLTKYRNNSSSI